MNRKHNEGFTLVELLVTIVIASIVALAASTVLLLGIRLNSSASATAQRQNTVRIFMAVMEKMATEGTIGQITSEPDSWQVQDPENKTLFYFDSAARTIYTGGEMQGGAYTGGTPMMEDVLASHITMTDQLLTVSVETVDGSYNTSAYCRQGATLDDKTTSEIVDQDGNLLAPPTEIAGKEARAELLKILLEQRGSTGMILEKKDGAMIKTPAYYVKWYNQEWDIDTPWCGCFLSWGLNQVSDKIDNPANPKDGKYLWFANVDNFMAFLVAQNGQENGYMWVAAQSGTPAPGDIIFFDWTRNQTDPSHVGVVLAVKDDYVYTIEGNSANMVAVRKYKSNDTVIMGYGIIAWKENGA